MRAISKAARISLGSMSLSFKAILEKTPANYTGLYVMKCGMARGIPEKGIWIQSSPSVENPYFGQDHGMSDCAIEILKITKSGLVEIE